MSGALHRFSNPGITWLWGMAGVLRATLETWSLALSAGRPFEEPSQRASAHSSLQAQFRGVFQRDSPKQLIVLKPQAVAGNAL